MAKNRPSGDQDADWQLLEKSSVGWVGTYSIQGFVTFQCPAASREICRHMLGPTAPSTSPKTEHQAAKSPLGLSQTLLFSPNRANPSASTSSQGVSKRPGSALATGCPVQGPPEASRDKW